MPHELPNNLEKLGQTTESSSRLSGSNKVDDRKFRRHQKAAGILEKLWEMGLGSRF
jgi:hypothetical protein